MALKLNVGLSKKIGLPDYGSLGASVNLELELDSGAIGEPDRFRQQIRHLFGLAKASVENELQSQQRITPHRHDLHPNEIDVAQSNSQTNRKPGGTRHGAQRYSRGRAATNSQVRAIRAITSRQGVDLEELLSSRFRLQRLEDLSVADASRFIDELRNGVRGFQQDENSNGRTIPGPA